MKKAYSLIIGALITSNVCAGQYTVDRLTNVYADSTGRVMIKWAGSPRPGPCGENYGWVSIPVGAPQSMSALAFSIYFVGKPARINTNGCDDGYEAVSALYSPGG